MDGVAAVRSLLVEASAVTDLVPAGRISAGDLPQGTQLPALSIDSISKTDRNIPNPGAQRHVAERVQVTAHAKNYPSQKALLRAVRGAAADKFPTVAGISNVTVHTEGAGPDFKNEDAKIYLGSQDFLVTYTEDR